jgi:hypothetical protein
MTFGVIGLSLLATVLIVLNIAPGDRHGSARKDEQPAGGAIHERAASELPRRRADVATSDEAGEEAPTVAIELEGLTRDARVYLDGVRSDLPISVPVSHTPVSLRVTAPGYADYEETLVPDRDQTVRVSQKRVAKRESKREIPARRPAREKKPPEKSAPLPEGWEENPFE